MGAIEPRKFIAVAGGERASYLQGLLTNDIQALTPGTGCYAAWLTPQGRMLTDLHVLEAGDMLLLDVPAGLAGATIERLDQFLFGEDVQLAAMDDGLTAVHVHGPLAAAALHRVMPGLSSPAGWPQYHVERATFGSAPVVAARIDQIGVPGYCLYLPPSDRESLESALRGEGVVDASPAALEALRIEAGYPLFGVDMTEDTIPLEAGIESRAISFSKGCYVGQEVIIRVLHRGHGRVAKRLVPLRLDGPPAAGGAKLFAAEREVGFVTSSAVSPPQGTIALGYVHRDFVEPGTALALGAGAEQVRVTVAARPLAGAQA